MCSYLVNLLLFKAAMEDKEIISDLIDEAKKKAPATQPPSKKKTHFSTKPTLSRYEQIVKRGKYDESESESESESSRDDSSDSEEEHRSRRNKSKRSSVTKRDVNKRIRNKEVAVPATMGTSKTAKKKEVNNRRGIPNQPISSNRSSINYIKRRVATKERDRKEILDEDYDVLGSHKRSKWAITPDMYAEEENNEPMVIEKINPNLSVNDPVNRLAIQKQIARKVSFSKKTDASGKKYISGKMEWILDPESSDSSITMKGVQQIVQNESNLIRLNNKQKRIDYYTAKAKAEGLTYDEYMKRLKDNSFINIHITTIARQLRKEDTEKGLKNKKWTDYISLASAKHKAGYKEFKAKFTPQQLEDLKAAKVKIKSLYHQYFLKRKESQESESNDEEEEEEEEQEQVRPQVEVSNKKGPKTSSSVTE